VRQKHATFDARRQPFDARLIGRGDLRRLNSEVGARVRLAQQHETFGGFRQGYSQRRPVGVVDLTLQQPGAAGAAIAALAAMRQIQGSAERRVEHRLIRRRAESDIGLG
jgi:hypothetical protein